MNGSTDLARPRGHIPALDGIRGIAVLAVMLFHFFQFGGMVADGALARVAAAAASTGWAGVDLFFVLSGFLITGILLDTRERPGYFRTFYARRSLRIFPLYYAVLVAFFVLLPLAAPDNPTVDAATRGQGWYWTYLSNVHTALHGWGSSSRFVDHFWSLAVEEQFYLVWPLLVLALSRRALLAACLAIAVGSLGVRGWLHAHDMPTVAFVLTPARMDALAIGAATAVVVRDRVLYGRVARRTRAVLVSAAVLLVGIAAVRGTFDKNDALVGTAGFTLLAVGFAALLVEALVAPPGSRTARFFNAGGLRSLGKYSYALYVFHQPVALLLGAVGVTGALARVAGALGGQLLFVALAGAISIGAALASWHLFERHFLALKDRFSYRQAAGVAASLLAAASLGTGEG